MNNFETRGNDPAFPDSDGEGGLTKREYFAAMAMQGYCSHQLVDLGITARWAVQQADALISALNKEPK